LLELARLLADPAAPARINAARALAARGGEDALPLLHLRVLAGDPSPEVVGECLGAALFLAFAPSLELAAACLDAGDEAIAEAAALALGGSREAGALAVLRAWCERSFDPERRRIGLVAVTLLRGDEALGWLLSLVRDGSPSRAAEAIEALAARRGDTALEARLRETIEARGDDGLAAAMRRAFT